MGARHAGKLRLAAAVAPMFGVHVSTIDRMVNCYWMTGSTKDRPRPGQRRVITANQDHYIV